jgi:polyisoprenoid-binding protein YceI
MRKRLLLLVALAVAAGPARAWAADTYAVDPVHSSFSFSVSHLGISDVHGRFNDVSGTFTLDTDAPAKSSFTLTIQVASIDTAVKKRDDHLRSPDFFDAKKYPTMTFKSTAVKAVAGGYQVTGDLTLHGVTKSVTFTLKGGKTAEFPKGMKRIGFTTALTIKRSDFGMKTMIPAVGDEVRITIGMEGVKK